MKLKSLLPFLAAVVLGMFTFSASAGTLNYSYSQSDELYQWGLKTAQTYDIAIELDGSFAGMKISDIAVPVIMTENIEDFKVWLTSELAVDDVDGKKVNRTDLMCESVEPIVTGENFGYISYNFPEAYTIPSNGLYVGYSFTVAFRGGELEQYPVLVTQPGVEGGMFVHSSKTYRAWKDRAMEIDAVSALVVSLEADIAQNAVAVTAPRDIAAQAGQARQTPVTVANHGMEEVANISYTLSVDGTPYQGEFVFDEPIVNVFNRSAIAMIDIPALEVGQYEYTLEITKVNGADNGEKAVAEGQIRVLEVMPVKRPLMEEYTGTWCGWCPRGWVAMEKMSEFHPDFVSIAYHNGDDMQISTYPAMESGYPSAFMDRTISCDPYYGTGNQPFGIEDLWKELSEEYAPVEITLEANKSADNQTVTVTSDVFWALDPGEGTYKVEYVLVGDGLSKNTWVQSNNYSTYSAAQGGLYMELFCSGGEYGKSRVLGLPYNDVALLNTGGKGLAGSIESSEPGSHNIYTHTFNLSESSVIDLAQNLRVVAMVLKDNGRFGTVLNSNKVDVKAEVDGINAITGSAEIVSTKYYDLTGREIANPANGGIYMRSVGYSDGRVETTKVLK